VDVDSVVLVHLDHFLDPSVDVLAKSVRMSSAMAIFQAEDLGSAVEFGFELPNETEAYRALERAGVAEDALRSTLRGRPRIQLQ